jgi:hypothetical protein
MTDENLCTVDTSSEPDPYYTLTEIGSLDDPSEDDMNIMFESTM